MRTTLLVVSAGLLFAPAGTRADDPPKRWDFTGRTQADARVEVRARVTGQLTRVAVKEGAVVKKGDLLAEIDARPYRLDREAAQARLKVAEAKLQAAKLRSGSASRLQKDKVISPGEVALNKAAEAEAEAAVMAARVEMQRAELTLSWTQVTAPFDGRVSRIPATEGNLVAADQTLILTVVATHQLHVTFNVPESTLLRLRRDGLANSGKLNVAVGFALDEGCPHQAKLELISPEVDPNTGMAQFRAALANPKGLFSPGMFARVRLTVPTR